MHTHLSIVFSVIKLRYQYSHNLHKINLQHNFFYTNVNKIQIRLGNKTTNDSIHNITHKTMLKTLLFQVRTIQKNNLKSNYQKQQLKKTMQIKDVLTQIFVRLFTGQKYKMVQNIKALNIQIKTPRSQLLNLFQKYLYLSTCSKLAQLFNLCRKQHCQKAQKICSFFQMKREKMMKINHNLYTQQKNYLLKIEFLIMQ
eukprot:TRINITY_DN42090_c0_g1_i1.p3 TRINITY_DN42090_c0_g1~~TRINITY_DN42090_c0_g1_i1.p3  ORF type:complete len:198 (+),score=-13.96 TRINITY_DN42090_c0_g1_i1:315-908(+)